MWKYNKTYTSERETQYRYDIFKTNMEKINEHNSKNYTWKMSINQWSDMSWEEFSNSKISRVTLKEEISTTDRRISRPINRPLSLDWRNFGVVGPIQNQKNCGSCWAFASISCIESAYAIRRKINLNLSEQQLVDCSRRWGNNGCNGGWMLNAYRYILSNPICKEDDYPYVARDQSCKKCKGVLRVRPGGSFSGEDNYLNAVNIQPIAIALFVSPEFQSYQSGIFDWPCDKTANHAVVVVGYHSNPDYWIIRNSWGENWGENGYMRIVRGKNMCRIGRYSTNTITIL
jgi:cathepsin L